MFLLTALFWSRWECQSTSRNHGVKSLIKPFENERRNSWCTCPEDSDVLNKEITFPLKVKMHRHKRKKIPPMSSL